MLRNKTLTILSVLTLSLTLSSQAKAVDPISIAGMFVSPIFCKIISCKDETTNFLFTEDPEGSRKRLKEMRKEFKWDKFMTGLYEEGECTEFFSDISINNSNRGEACWLKGKWVIQEDDSCQRDPFGEKCGILGIRRTSEGG